MVRNIDNEILIYYLTSQDNTVKQIADRYEVSIHKVNKVIDSYFKEKTCKHEFYEIDSWTGLKQCKHCDKLKS